MAPASGPPDWKTLKDLAPTGLSHSITQAVLAAERERLLESPNADFTNLAAWVHLSTSGATDDQVVEAVDGNCQSMRALVADDGNRAFPELAVHFIGVDSALSKRAVLTRILVQAEEDPGLLTTPPKTTGDTTIFGSAWHLQEDLVLTRGAYLSPLFLGLSPWIWAVPSARVQGVVVYDLGTAIVGRQGQAAELLQQFLPPGSTASTPRPEIDSNDTLAATSWWLERIDKLLSELTDPHNYVDRHGLYRPRRQFEVLLSIEQLGRRIQSILANDRDLPSGRLAAFAALDTLDGLGIIAFDQACKLSRAEAALQKLESGLPASVTSMLLPAARRAVEGLRDCQEGFFLQSKVGPAGVQVIDWHGNNQTLSMEDAVASYLRVLRNANHGFTGENDAGRRRDQILLLSHDGGLPLALSFLPYLYWLETVADPTRFLSKLART